MTNPTTPQLSEAEINAIESLHRSQWVKAATEYVPALIRDWRALQARLVACEGSRRVHELDNHHNALACGYCAGPIKDESTRVTADNAALREQLERLEQKHGRLSEKYRSADVHVAALLNARCGSAPTHLGIEHSLSIIDRQFDETASAAATRMREACVGKVKALIDERVRELHVFTNDDNHTNDAEYTRAVLYVLHNVITELESLTLDNEEQKQK